MKINESGGSLTGDSAGCKIEMEPVTVGGTTTGTEKNTAGFVKCMYPRSHQVDCPNYFPSNVSRYCAYLGDPLESCMHPDALRMSSEIKNDNVVGFNEAWKPALHFSPVSGGQRVTQGEQPSIDTMFRALEHRFREQEAELRAMRLRAEQAESLTTQEIDHDGLLTDWACAMDAILDAGCDCGTDEPGTCLGCVCKQALLTERRRAEKVEAERDKAKVHAYYFEKESMDRRSERDELSEQCNRAALALCEKLKIAQEHFKVKQDKAIDVLRKIADGCEIGVGGSKWYLSAEQLRKIATDELAKMEEK